MTASPAALRASAPASPAQGPLIVLGHAGTLGQAVMRVAADRGWRTLGFSRRSVPGLNWARVADLAPYFKPLAPALVINAAAISDVGAAEADPMAAMEVHARLPGLLAEWAQRSGTPWVQVCTDHYWSANENLRHAEEAPVKPPNMLARSWHEGEQLALRDPGCLLVRTHVAGFRGHAGQPTFVEGVAAALARAEPVDACTDVWASPIEAHQLAEAVFDLVDIGVTGRLHVAGRDAVSQADFVEAFIRAGGHGPDQLRRTQRPARQHPRRANATGLDVSRAEAWLGRRLPALDEVAEALAASPAMPKPTLLREFDVEVG
ncbi:MAG: sugar nucleotide-binding protein [Rubrivivax sp.]|nr:sugar nucleotide-binding protein [Rubrivivax sp.]